MDVSWAEKGLDGKDSIVDKWREILGGLEAKEINTKNS